MRLFALTLLTSFALFGQGQPPGPPPGGKMPEPKNLKLLKPENLMPTMHAFSAALGSKCDFCHVKGDFASDEKPEKQTARMMIVMAREINAKFPDGKMHVTCYTCHRGAHEPATRPPESEHGQEAEHGK